MPYKMKIAVTLDDLRSHCVTEEYPTSAGYSILNGHLANQRSGNH